MSNQATGQAYFILCHHDDELMVLPLLERSRAEGLEPLFIFVTDSGGKPRRAAESIACLRHWGVATERILFLGAERGFADCHLHEHAESLYAALAAMSSPDLIVTHAWEGGHPDHDTCLAVVHALLSGPWKAAKGLQCASYNCWQRKHPLFRTATPLPANGPVFSAPLPRHYWWRYTRSLFFFADQWRVMAVLGPLFLFSYLTRGYRYQEIAAERPLERPHDGPLRYELAYGVSFADVAGALEELA